MNTPAQPPHTLIRWASLLGIVLGIGAPLLALGMALATGAGLLGWQTSLGSLFYLPYVAMAGGTLAFIALIGLAVGRRWRLMLWPMIALVLAGGFVGVVSYSFGKAATVPPIHDVTTDLDNLPTFETLSVRPDNLENVPDGGDEALAALEPEQRWRRYHEQAYGDLDSIVVPVTVPEAVGAAEMLVEERGWELAVADPATGRVEATDTVSIYRFKDDVVLRITPDPDGRGSIVDMRSVSRVGISDLGVNAERIRAFLADLQAATDG